MRPGGEGGERRGGERLLAGFIQSSIRSYAQAGLERAHEDDTAVDVVLVGLTLRYYMLR